MSLSTSYDLVFQGEYAIKKSDQEQWDVKTTRPLSCHILVLHDRNQHIGSLSHIDDYTSVASLFSKIDEILIKRFKQPEGIKSCKFKASLMGGTSDPYSKSQKKVVKFFLETFGIECNDITLKQDLDERPQIFFNTYSGDLHFFADKEVDQTLEKLQRQEYAAFLKTLDINYPSQIVVNTPYFSSKESNRTNAIFSDIKEMQKHISFQREEDITNSPWYQFEKIIKNLSNEILLKTLNEKKDLNLLFRQSAASPQAISLFKCLFNYAKEPTVNIDIHARGKTSGSALDIAQKNNNVEAIELLKNAKSS